ncbi:MAG: hypothetical protein LBB89_06040 [Treponema sp.]|nr:hypothetical protein [Treponema sp.]
MGENTVDIGGALKKAFPSLVMFVIGFIITYEVLEERNIFYCVIFGWLFGGTIWGWFLSAKWFPSSDTVDTSSMWYAIRFFLRIATAIVVGIVAMPIEIGRLIMAIVKAKQERDLAKAKRAENE